MQIMSNMPCSELHSFFGVCLWFDLCEMLFETHGNVASILEEC